VLFVYALTAYMRGHVGAIRATFRTRPAPGSVPARLVRVTPAAIVDGTTSVTPPASVNGSPKTTSHAA